MKRVIWSGLIAVASALSYGSMSAQEARVHTDVDVAETTVGGQILLTVAVEHAAGARVVFPDSVDLGPFEALSLTVGEPVPEGDRYLSIGRYTLAAFELGELEIPSFEVALIDENGNATALDTSPWGVVVTSVGLDETGDIRDVKAPFEIPLGTVVIASWILGLLLLAALAYWLYRRHQRQDAAAPVEVAAPIRRPWEIAEDALRELEASGMLQRGEIKEFYIRVSEIIRAYVEAQFHVPALEMASFEVIEGIQALGLDRATVQAFEGFLAECDLVKFAKFRPDAARASEIVSRAWRLVERTKVGRPAPPKPVPEPGGEPVADPDQEASADSAIEADPEPSADSAVESAMGSVVDPAADPAAEAVPVADLAPESESEGPAREDAP